MWTRKNLSEALNVDERICHFGRNISIDSRTIKKDDIFLAFKGERFDGHDFLHQAQDKMVSCAIVERVNKNIIIPQIKVKNCYHALIELAKYRIKLAKNTKIIAITGSVGKTSLKENLQFILNKSYKCYYSKGNFNNHIGVPLSAINLDLESDFAIFELGMNHEKEISFLTKIIMPDIAVITRISDSHIGNFKNISGIINAKLEIIDGLKKNGKLIIGNDNCFSLIQRAVKNLKNIDKFYFGMRKNNDLYIKKCNKWR